jgi:regulatory protein YycH of two-component signal transduction system YycFG
MNKESIKSAALIALIVISLFFTWNIWSLQPSYDNFQNNGFYESVPISEGTRDFYEVIKPQQLFFHAAENHYSSINETNSMLSLWKEMQDWEYSNERNQSTVYTKEKLQSLIHGNGEAKLELRFYDEIPMATFQSMVDWEKDINQTIEFDRILLNVEKDSEVQKVYFVSYDKMKVVETTVNQSEASQFVGELYNKREEFQPYFSYETGQGNEIMLPENQVELESYQYLTEEIEGEKFKEALFVNPQIVKQDVSISKNRYTDGTRELNIYPTTQMVKYVNPTLKDTNPVEANFLIEQSIKFLNDHGGWTDNYVLFDIQESDQEVKFIMSIHSIPVINSMENQYGPTMISQRWGQNEIAIYERPLYELIMTPLSSNSLTLMSGRKVEEIINKNQQLDKTQINNIFIAYELGGSDSQQTVKVAPVWCIEMVNGTLIKMTEVVEQPGGDENGLE